MLHDIRDNGLDNIKEKVKVWLKNYFKWEKTRVTVWEPKLGEYQAELYIPVGMHDLKTLPRITYYTRRYITKASNVMNNYMPENSNWNFWDTFYSYKPSGDVNNWVPPFEGKIK